MEVQATESARRMELLEWLVGGPEKDPEIAQAPDHSQRVITVRIDTRIHEQLKDLAHRRKLSLNMLCVRSLTALVEIGTLPEAMQ